MLNMNEILGFTGDNKWLSNFEPCTILFEGQLYKSVEHAFVASKTVDKDVRKSIQLLENAGKVKKFGRTITLRDDWEEIKVEMMRQFLIQKFSQDPLMQKLINTGDAFIEETNYWNDTFWGVCNGKGENTLGKLIMEIREDIKVVHSLNERE